MLQRIPCRPQTKQATKLYMHIRTAVVEVLLRRQRSEGARPPKFNLWMTCLRLHYEIEDRPEEHDMLSVCGPWHQACALLDQGKASSPLWLTHSVARKVPYVWVALLVALGSGSTQGPMVGTRTYGGIMQRSTFVTPTSPLAGGPPFLVASSRLVARWTLILLLCAVRCVHTLTEQPASSKMPEYPYIKWLSDVLGSIGVEWSSTHLSGPHGVLHVPPCFG